LFGDGGGEFDPDGRRLIVVAEKPGGGLAALPPRVTLRELNDHNARAVCELKLAPGQDTYVAPASYTLAEAQFDPHAWVRAIYADEAPVGVLAVHEEPEAAKYFLVRLLIGAQYQGQGFGRAAVGLVAERVRGLPGARRLETSCVPGPDSPTAFYRRLGFEDTGVVWHDENVLALAL
jgi:diamine N-acetyltransferase